MDDTAETRLLDVIAIGRSSVDLYGQQIGSRLEDIASFAKSVGGCPANIAIGTARLGLRSALVTRVGAEQMGNFIREQLSREGVETRGVVTDPQRLTALVLLAVEADHTSPMIFYREDCADMALSEEDIDPAFIASSHALVVTGTHFSRPNTGAAQWKAIRAAKEAGTRVVLDVDYRPNLWGLAGHAEGFARYVKSDRVSAQLRPVLPECDLIVGTEEEILIASGAEDLLAALRTIRSVSAATIVLKRGPMGCIVYDGPISDRLEDGILGQGFPIEVYNVLGAGDAFMSGLLRGWLGGESWSTAATWANACGAFAVSRLLCSPEIPTFPELQHFLRHGSPHRALRRDADLNHIHWATTRRPQPESILALACDHRAQIEALADRLGVPRQRIDRFKALAVEAAARVAGGRDGYGVLIDGTYGTEAFAKVPRNFWIGRPVEKPGSRPLAFDGMADLGSHLRNWPLNHTVKCLCFYHPDDPAGLREQQEQALLQLHEATRGAGLELMVEIIAAKTGPLGDDTVALAIRRLYALGIRPDLWKLEANQGPAAWHAIDEAILANDPYCRGILLLGLEAPEAELMQSFRQASLSRLVRGFAVGRTIFAEAVENWLAGRIGDEDAIAEMAARFGRLVEGWQALRQARAA
ncbi:5-dehydro-2-deoxygluconokinase (plasmid) [Roseomonas gilardii subsp. gilardii]|uniref:bifunctional 5-dehydro-2-deoxygluconokinase/5-dehydro-2- deoxyphosphogluconate aldolase n=1 Tax=Roseomonas gilardii TaxID=257708 RepID=UPI001FF888FB|nr:5-dehydro-2-deoxygluconokinase [Roseomonas gilardii]UPG74689.1 5-dehydro-2-deoxygluconokinase [Roseomonas gilardii subsp. gilardii]